jgi:hypothetical protein
MVLIGVYYLINGVGLEVLSSTCLAIPLASFYLWNGPVRLKPAYIIIDFHFFFWVIFSVLRPHIVPLVMFALFMSILLKRKANFIKTF